MATQSDKINKLDKEVALIKKDIHTIKTNHLFHLEKKIDTTLKVLGAIAVLVLSNLFVVIRDSIL